jgi:hypothetical protein
MANIMSLKSLRNKTSRNGFDLSFKKNFTAKAGELLPVMVKEVLPGDSFKINLKSFTRTQPINTAAFARIREYYDFYFVPYDLLWNKSNTALTQMYDNPQHAVSLDPTQNFLLDGVMPSVTAKAISDYLASFGTTYKNYDKNYFGYSRSECSAKLLEYLGYGRFYDYVASSGENWSSMPLMSNLTFNIFGLLAYQKIYADYYRDSQWERVSPSTFNVDYMDGTSNMSIDGFITGTSSSKIVQNYNLFDLRYCNWQKDLFHGVVPHQQYGDLSAVSIGKIPPADEETGFTILALRQAEFLQKWKEITQSGNKDYKDQIEKHWGVSVGDGFSELCTYLGGVSSSLDINEVVNTNITGENAADIAGKGTGVSNGVIDFNSGGKYGLLVCIYHCLPLLDYTATLLNSAFTKVRVTDYAIPEFDRVGMELVPLRKMINPLASDFSTYADSGLGYAPRYIDYKTSVDCSIGGFSDTLRNWVISYSDVSILNQLGSKDPVNQPQPTAAPMNYTFFKVNPNCLDPLFAVAVNSGVSTDQFLCSSFFDIKVVRNLDTDGLPY